LLVNQGDFTYTMILIPQEDLTFIRVLGKGGCEPGREFVGNGQIRKNMPQIS